MEQKHECKAFHKNLFLESIKAHVEKLIQISEKIDNVCTVEDYITLFTTKKCDVSLLKKIKEALTPEELEFYVKNLRVEQMYS